MSENRDFDIQALKMVLNGKGASELKVVSDSMEPLIKVGESIVLEKSQLNQLKIFDIIVFNQGARLNCHYLTKTDHKRDQFITRSLKNPTSQDYPIQSKDIIARVKNKKLSWWHKSIIMIRSLLS